MHTINEQYSKTLYDTNSFHLFYFLKLHNNNSFSGKRQQHLESSAVFHETLDPG